MKRRDVLRALGAAAAAGALVPGELPARMVATSRSWWPTQALRVAVVLWQDSLDDLCEAAKGIGFRSIELLDEQDWGVPARHGMACAMANGFGTIPSASTGSSITTSSSPMPSG